MYSKALYLPQTGRSLRQAGKQSVLLTKHQITLPGWNLLLWQQRMRRIWCRIVSLEAVLCRGGDSTDSELRAIEKAFYLPRILSRYVVILVVVFNWKSIGQPARGGCHSFIYSLGLNLWRVAAQFVNRTFKDRLPSPNTSQNYETVFKDKVYLSKVSTKGHRFLKRCNPSGHRREFVITGWQKCNFFSYIFLFRC